MDYKNLLLIIECYYMIGISVGEHVRLGHYPNITSDTCGITKKGWRLDPCLKRSSRNVRSLRVIYGRDAHTGEFPFVVGYKYEKHNYFDCTGSILNNKWILIAAHCLTSLNDTNTCQVYVGYTKFPTDKDKYYTCEKTVIHKKYKEDEFEYDIGLIKLKEAIIMDEKQHYFKINSVCLPEPNIVNNEYEFALFAGWGQLNLYQLNRRQLQAVTFKIFPVNGCRYANDDKKIVTVFNQNKAHTSNGDSGGPLIQYVDGRAVVIGVAAHVQYDWSDCGSYNTVFTRVSKFIDFINNTINANK